MRAMILAAGRGSRMGALTAKTPKPLLRVGGQYLIEYALKGLVAAGIKEMVINIAYQADQIRVALGDGTRYGCDILYSQEDEALETGGGILKALPLLGEAAFLVMSADIITDFPFATLPREPAGLAHLVMVDNPPYHPAGDFGLGSEAAWVMAEGAPKLTFANIGVYRPDLFAAATHCQGTAFPLRQLLLPAIARQQISGEYYAGHWHNVGTPEDLLGL